jgi:hypothetical protein
MAYILGVGLDTFAYGNEGSEELLIEVHSGLSIPVSLPIFIWLTHAF